MPSPFRTWMITAFYNFIIFVVLGNDFFFFTMSPLPVLPSLYSLVTLLATLLLYRLPLLYPISLIFLTPFLTMCPEISNVKVSFGSKLECSTLPDIFNWPYTNRLLLVSIAEKRFDGKNVSIKNNSRKLLYIKIVEFYAKGIKELPDI